MGGQTDQCLSHTDGYYSTSCSYYRGRYRNTLTFSTTPASAVTVGANEWNQLKDYINWERGQRNLGGFSLSIDSSTVITDAIIETLRDNLESIAGATNPDRPSELTNTVYYETLYDGGGDNYYYIYTGSFSSAGGWVNDSVSTWANINDTNYTSTLIYSDILLTLRNKLNEIMSDCVCNANCGAYSYCSCYTNYCSSYYVG